MNQSTTNEKFQRNNWSNKRLHSWVSSTKFLNFRNLSTTSNSCSLSTSSTKITNSSRIVTSFVKGMQNQVDQQSFGWVYFRAPTVQIAERTLNAMLGLNSWNLAEAWFFINFNRYYSVAGLFGIFWIFFLEPYVRSQRQGRPWHALSVSGVPMPALVSVLLLFVWAMVCAIADRNSPFLYFQFWLWEKWSSKKF